MTWSDLRCLKLVSVTVACTGCEAILGFGDTSLFPAADVSIRTSAGDDASTDGHVADANNDNAMAEEFVSTLPDVVFDGPRDQPESESSHGSDAGEASPDAIDAGQGAVADASDAGMPEAGSWTPAELPHLSLWLEGDVGVASAADQVISWSDQSGNNNTASQAVAGQRPRLVVSALNGHAVLRFDGVATYLAIPDSQSLRWGTGDYTIEIVASFSNAPDAGDGYGMIFGKQITTFPFPGPALWANYPPLANPTVFATQVQWDQYIVSSANDLNDSLKRVYGARRTGGTNLEARINGATTAAAAVPSVDVSAAGSFVFIGGQLVANSIVQALNGDVAEIVAVGGTMTGADLAKLEAYLKAKYGL